MLGRPDDDASLLVFSTLLRLVRGKEMIVSEHFFKERFCDRVLIAVTMNKNAAPSVISSSMAMAEFNNLHELHELCRLRSTLEAFAAVRVRSHADAQSLEADFLQHLARMKRFAAEGRYREFHDEDMKLHRTLVESAGIPALVRSWEDVADSLSDWIRHVKKVYWPSLMTLYREHEFLIEAWSSEETWVAEQATHHHLEAGWFRVASAQGLVVQDIHPVDRATSFICTHFASEIEVEWLAQNVSFVSASHLTRLFRERLGIAPHAFLKQVRIERAAELLKTRSDSVALVARKIGYKNTSHFVRDFRQRYRITPKQYRLRGDA